MMVRKPQVLTRTREWFPRLSLTRRSSTCTFAVHPLFSIYSAVPTLFFIIYPAFWRHSLLIVRLPHIKSRIFPTSQQLEVGVFWYFSDRLWRALREGHTWDTYLLGEILVHGLAEYMRILFFRRNADMTSLPCTVLHRWLVINVHSHLHC